MHTNPWLRSFLFQEASDDGTAQSTGSGSASGGAPSTGSTSTSSGSSSQQQQQQPPPEATFDFRTLVTEKGEFVEGWQEKLPAEYDPHRKALANYKDFGGLAKSLVDSMTAARAKTEGMVKIPAADAKPEERAAFLKALGVPEKPEEYGLKAPEKLPEGMEWSDEFAQGFMGEAHKLGLTKAQVEGLSAWHLQHMTQQHQSVETQGAQAYEAEVSKLRQTFGENFERRTLDAKRAAMTLGLPDDHPVFWRADTVIAMAKLADMMGEDKMVTAQQASNKLSPGTQAHDIITNPDNPDYKAYYDPSHGRHKEVVAFVNGQMAREYPGGR